jgi:NAD(P)-dependent dehydrogenase (short-subunit alcohol dehydrogenase family)
MLEQVERTAVVTGAASGIGAAIADRFEKDGWNVFRFGKGVSNDARCVEGDVREADDWESLARNVINDVGHLDVLINNAGILREARLQDTTLEIWNELQSVNVTGTFLGCRTMLPLLRKGNAPTILNLSSIDALKGSVGHSAYAATKGAIASMTRALALELAEEGITVNALCPGTVDTPMMHSLIGNPLNAGVDKVAQHPLGRVSSVDDQAAAAAFLCSADASYITGVTLSVDGGRAIR